MALIKLQSADGKVFEVDQAAARTSFTIKNMLELTDEDDESPDNFIPLTNVNSTTLEKVIAWANHHKNDPAPSEEDEEKEKKSDDISSWDADFLKVDQRTLFDLMLAANYLDIKGLLDLTCKSVANMIIGKTPEEIRTKFKINNDFTPAEEDQIRKENEWCDDK